MPPRQFKASNNPNMTEEEKQRMKKAKLSHDEECKEHDADKEKIKELIKKHQVELIVIGANKLEARQIKEVFINVASGLTAFGSGNDEETKKGSKRRDRDEPEEKVREASVIWGSLEVPKLFANSH